MMEALFAYPESSVMFTLAVVALVLVSIFKEDFFRPSTLYFLVQMVMLGISYLKFLPMMSDFRYSTWLVWGGGMFCFLMGCYITDFAWRSLGGPPLQDKIKIHGEYNWVCHFFLSFSAFAYFFVGVIGVISVTGNLVLLTDNPSQWLTGKDNDVLKYADFFTSGAMVVGLFAVASFKSMNPVRWVRYASRFMVVFTMALSFATYPSRGINMLCFGMFIILFNYLRGRFSWRSLAVMSVLVGVFFVAVAALKGQYGNSDVTDSKIAKEVALLPYKYVANNYWNLDYAFNRMNDMPEHEWTYGIDAFFGITHLMHIGDGIQQSFGWDTPFNESIVKYPGLNTIPYLWDAYKDFGLPGIFLLPFFFGVLFTFCYHKMAVAKNPFTLLLTATFMMWIILWNFTTGYKQSMYWVWMSFFFFVCTVSSGKRLILPADPDVAGVELAEGTPACELQTRGDREDIDSRLRGNDE
jgi:oligosaccharide repeat unit polymerase